MLHDICRELPERKDDKCANFVSFVTPYKHYPKTEYRLQLNSNASKYVFGNVRMSVNGIKERITEYNRYCLQQC